MKHLILTLLLLLQYTLSVEVDLVLFNVAVLDDDGDAVTGLKPGNFRVFEDDREQEIKVFQGEDSPATVGLIIDNSGSMTTKRRDVVLAARSFVAGTDEQDEVFIVNFNRRAWLALPVAVPFTSDVNQLRTALLTIGADGTTALYDALELALQHLEKGTNRQKALVILSDGADNASLSTLEEVLKAAQRSSATLYTIGIYDREQRDRNPAVLRELAKLTGGEAFFPRRPADLHEIWTRVAGSIRGQYTLGYVSTNRERNGSFRKVKITANTDKGRRFEVRTRPGYLAPAARTERKDDSNALFGTYDQTHARRSDPAGR
jgi:VWFA-related protein